MATESQQPGFRAIVLAGDRSAADPLLSATGKPCKALIEIGGVPMVFRVLETLAGSGAVEGIVLSGPSQSSPAVAAGLSARLAELDVDWRTPQQTPSTSAHVALEAIDPAVPALLTTADHPLLTGEMVRHFCAASRATGADVTVGLAPYALVQAAFPTMRKTVLRFSDGEFCGCNLFAFMTPAGRAMADFWRQVERERKSPLKVIRILGWQAVLRYRFGKLSLDEAMDLLSRRTGLRLAAVRMPFADAAVDVDSPSDYALVQQRFAAATTAAPGGSG